MDTIASRLTNTGTLLVNGAFDEVTYNTSSPTVVNLFETSNNFSYNGYSRTVTANATVAPDGTRTASLFQESSDASSTYHGCSSQLKIVTGGTLIAGTTYTISVFIKDYSGDRQLIYGLGPNSVGASSYGYGRFNPATGGAALFLSSGGSPSVSIENHGNGWYRSILTVTPTITYPVPPTTAGLDIQLWNASGGNLYQGNGTSGMYLWGLQIEVGTTATPYQPIIANLVTPTFATKTVINSVYTTGQFDEVTYTSGFAKRETQTGNLYVTGGFDEYTGAPVVDGNLKCWLDASQTASYPGTGTIWYDLSGNGSNAVLNGPVYNNTSAAMNFNGGYISIPVGNVANITTTTAVTASVWFNSTTADTSYRRLISRDSYPNQNWYIEYNGDAASVGNVFSYSGTAGTGNTPITSNVWYNLTMTATASNVCLYKNGTLTIYNGTATTFLANTSAIGIGADANGGTQFLGNISQVMIYNRALSPDEVAQNFNALRRRYNI